MPRNLSHAGAWGQCVIVHSDNKTAKQRRSNCALEKVVRGEFTAHTYRRLPRDIQRRKIKEERMTDQSRMTRSTNPSSKWTTIRCLVAIVMTKMSASWKKDSIAILLKLIVLFKAF